MPYAQLLRHRKASQKRRAQIVWRRAQTSLFYRPQVDKNWAKFKVALIPPKGLKHLRNSFLFVDFNLILDTFK